MLFVIGTVFGSIFLVFTFTMLQLNKQREEAYANFINDKLNTREKVDALRAL